MPTKQKLEHPKTPLVSFLSFFGVSELFWCVRNEDDGWELMAMQLILIKRNTKWVKWLIKLSVLLPCRLFLVRWWVKQGFVLKDFQMKPESDPPFSFIYLTFYIKFMFFISFNFIFPSTLLCWVCMSMKSHNGHLLIFLHIIKSFTFSLFLVIIHFPFFFPLVIMEGSFLIL